MPDAFRLMIELFIMYNCRIVFKANLRSVVGKDGNNELEPFPYFKTIHN
jgi:hypothetical protein